jgi:uncharacterized membrane protein YkvA (DUF1232 family)
MRADRSTVKAVLVGLGALAYGASPIDVIPDFLPLTGLGDDAVVLATAAVVIVRIIRSRKVRQRDTAGRTTAGRKPSF